MTSPEQIETDCRNAALNAGKAASCLKALRNEDLGHIRCHAEEKNQTIPEEIGFVSQK